MGCMTCVNCGEVSNQSVCPECGYGCIYDESLEPIEVDDVDQEDL